MDRQSSKNCPVDGFEWRKDEVPFDVKSIKNYGKDSDKGYILDVNYPKELHELHSDMLFLLETVKIEKCQKLLCNLYDKENYVIHIRAM